MKYVFDSNSLINLFHHYYPSGGSHRVFEVDGSTKGGK